MWLPYAYLFYGAMYGAQLRRPPTNVTAATATGQTTRVVCCESCGQRYAYELTRTAGAAVAGRSEFAQRAASQRAEAELQRLLAEAVEAVPCPACGWYQSSMIPEAQKRDCRWMLAAGQCLALLPVPVAAISTSINLTYADEGTAPIPWAIFAVGAASLVGLIALGIGLLWKYNLRHSYDPNRGDAEARIRYGQSRATLLSEQEG